MPGVLDPMLFASHAHLLKNSYRGPIVGKATRRHSPKPPMTEGSREKSAGQIACNTPPSESWIDDVPDEPFCPVGHSGLPRSVDDLEEPHRGEHSVKVGDTGEVAFARGHGQPVLTKHL